MHLDKHGYAPRLFGFRSPDRETLREVRGMIYCKRVIFPTGFVVSCGLMMRPWNVGKL